jgi:flagellar hook assembly protein FlgD
MLNDAAGKWELVPGVPQLSKRSKYLEMALSRTGIITLAGALVPATKISAVVNYPNPFRAGSEITRIRYVLTENMDVTASIYSMTGNLVWRKHIESGAAGAVGQATGYTNEIQWDGKNDKGETAANGMYVLELRSGSEKQQRKIGIVK